MWHWLASQNVLPCSTRTAARIVTVARGENYMSAVETNYDVIRKRTADIMNDNPGVLRMIEGRTDPDDVQRDQYEVVV